MSLLISITGPDKVGLIAAVTGRLYDLGANLGDTSFAVLGGGCEFSCMADFPEGVAAGTIRDALGALPPLAEADIRIMPLPFSTEHQETALVTHIIEVEGGDRPGLVARLSEVFLEFGANVVRMHSRRHSDLPESDGQYLTQFAVWVPAARADACLAAVHNTAGQLNLQCRYRAV